MSKGLPEEAIRDEKPSFLLGGQGVRVNGTFLVKRFGMSQPGVVYAVNRGGKIARERNLTLLE